MNDLQTGAAPAAAPTPALDLSAYREVVIEKSGEVAGHPYRRGSRHTVDADTLAALRAAGLVPPEPAASAEPEPSAT